MFNTFLVVGIAAGRLTGDSSSVHDSVVHLIKQHNELESFTIDSACSFSDSSLEVLLLHPNSRIIQLRNCSFISGENLFQKPNSETKAKLSLRVLKLRFCMALKDVGLVGLLNLTDGQSLTTLDLSCSGISLASLENLTTSFTKLEELRLVRCLKITNASAISFLNRVGDRLKVLDLSYTNISLADMEDLTKSFTKLEKLILVGCRNITNASAISFLNRVGTGLKVLDLSYTDISLASLEDLATSFTKLEKLILVGCRNITDASAICFLNRVGTGLKVLDLSVTNISLAGMEDLATSFNKFEELRLVDCRNITDASAISFLNRVGTGLKVLDLSVTNISLAGMEDLATSFTKLEKLILVGCLNITDASAISFLNRVGTGLKVLNLSYTDISLASLEDLTASFPELKVLNLRNCPNITEPGVISLLSKVGTSVRQDIVGTPVPADNIRGQFPSVNVIR